MQQSFSNARIQWGLGGILENPVVVLENIVTTNVVSHHPRLPRGEAFRFTPFMQYNGMGYAWVAEDGNSHGPSQPTVRLNLQYGFRIETERPRVRASPASLRCGP